LSQLLTLCVNNGEAGGSVQASLPQADSAAQLELASCRYPRREKASFEWCWYRWGFLSQHLYVCKGCVGEEIRCPCHGK